MASMDYEACIGCEDVHSDGSSDSYVDSSFFYTSKEAQDWVDERFEQMRGNGFTRLWGNIYYRGLIHKSF